MKILFVLNWLMLHIFQGKIEDFGAKKFIVNDFFGLEIYYLGKQSEGKVFLYPYRDDNRKTISYYAFDFLDERIVFEDMLKISGIGAKTAFQIVQLGRDSIQEAVNNLDVSFFQNIPGIGPKTAKKILLELKDSVAVEDLTQLEVDEKLYKNIVSSLKTLGYDASQVKNALKDYKGKITEKNMGEVIKWVIGVM